MFVGLQTPASKNVVSFNVTSVGIVFAAFKLIGKR